MAPAGSASASLDPTQSPTRSRSPPDSFAYDNVTARWQRDWNAYASNCDSLDARGQLIYWTQTVDGRTYTGGRTYDAFGRLTHRIVTWGSPVDSSVMGYSYDVPNPSPTHDIMCAFYSPVRCAVFTRNGDGRKDKTYFNWQGTGGTQWQSVLSLDSNHRITNDDYTISGNGLDVFDLTFTYDSVNRVTKRTSPLSGYTKRMFSYDSLGRLLNACDSAGGACHNVVDGSGSNAWSYDSTGNRAQLGTTKTYGAGNQLQVYGTTNFSYDNIGNLVCGIVGTCPGGSGAGYKYSFDALGRLQGIRNGSTGALIDSLYYDARGRRVRKGRGGGAAESYVYEGDQVILDVDSASGAVTREYAWYPGAVDRLFAMRTATDTLAALEDPRLGTLRGLARFRNGVIVKRYAESPWGDATADTGVSVRYRFAGREFDEESGLYFNRSRYYDPAIGRFVSEDPLGAAGGLNLYAYAGGDPINAADPTGLIWFCVNAELEYVGQTVDVSDAARPDTVNHWIQWQSCQDTNGYPSSNKGWGPSDAGSADKGKVSHCYEYNNFSSTITGLTGSTAMGRAASIVEVPAKTVFGLDVAAMILKAQRTGAGGPGMSASGVNLLQRSVRRFLDKPAGTALKLGDTAASTTLSAIGAFSFAYNVAIRAECWTGWIH